MVEYIEREALIAELCKGTIITDDLYGMGIMAGVDAAMKKIKSLPAADVAPVRHGQWESVGHKIRCSVCDNSVFLGTTDPYIHSCEKKNFNYCPNCGARMDLEVSE